jgi:hypothetical protein
VASRDVKPVTLEVTPVDGNLKISVVSEITVSTGNYESKRFGGSIEGIFDASLEPEAVGEYLLDYLYAAIDDELSLAKTFAKFNPKSVIHHIVQD